MDKIYTGKPDRKTPDITGSGGKAGVDDRNSDIFFAAIETTRMPMILTDPNQPDNPIVFANNAFLNMTGYERPEIVGHNCRFLQGPETDRDIVRNVRQAIDEKREVSVELLNYRKDGTTFWNALFISPVYNSEGKLVYFFASQLDVSRRRDAELALRQSQKMEAVGQLTGGVAHDFNNLLQVILGSLEIVQKQDVPYNPLTLRLLGAMEDAAKRAKNLTQQLLAFSRKQKLQGRIVNLNRLVTDMRELVQRTIGDDFEFRYDLDPALWTAHIDPTQAEMALINIIINARDAMPSGGAITIKTENRTCEGGDDIAYEGLLPGRYVVASITDTGCGMPEEILKHVMEPFFTTKDEGKGTGLGLSMVYGFAKQSGGAVRISSNVGEGTTVRIFFPASGLPERRDPGDSNRTIDRGGHERVLVVEDRVDVAELARAMLEDSGYGVEIALNGVEALKILDSGTRFDIMFSDLIMPGGMNGVSLARAVRQRFPKMKVLLTTGYSEAELERRDDGESEFELISKPYSKTDLIRKIRTILDGPMSVS